MCLFFCNAATVWVKIEVWRLYLNLQSAVWSSSDRMIDRWGVIIGRTATIMPIKLCLLLLPVLFLSVYQMMTIMQKAGHHHAASAHLFFFFFLWFCHPEVHLSEEKPAAAGELAAGSLGLVGAHHCSDVDVLHRTSGSIRLSLTLVQVSALLGWAYCGIDQGSRKTVREWQVFSSR